MASNSRALLDGVGLVLVVDVVDDMVDDGVGRRKVSALTRQTLCVVSELIVLHHSDEVGGKASHNLLTPIWSLTLPNPKSAPESTRSPSVIFSVKKAHLL